MIGMAAPHEKLLKMVRGGDYNPRVLSGANAKFGSGLRKKDYQPAREKVLWYRTYVLFSGSADLETSTGRTTYTSPLVVVVKPMEEVVLQVPPASELSWITSGVGPGELEITEGGMAHRYCKREVQAQPRDIWGLDIPLILPDRAYEFSARILWSICNQYYKSPTGWLRSNALLSQWILRVLDLLQRSADVALQSDNPRMQSLFDLVNARNDMQFTVDTWSRMAGISSRRLRDITWEATGRSPLDLLNEIRLQFVCRWMSGDPHDDRIWKRAGFSSPSSFGRWFKQQTGQTPGDWREVNCPNSL